MRSFRLIRATIASAALMCGCGGSSVSDATQTSIDVSGVWTLRSVGGTLLPYNIPSTAGRAAGDKYQLIYGSVEFISGGGNYALRDSTRYTSPGGFASVNVNGDDGSVTRSSAVLTLKSGRTGTTITANLVGSSLHAKRDDIDYVYTR